MAVAGPTGTLLLLVATLVALPGTDDLQDTASANAVILDIVAAHRDRTALAGLCVVLGLMLLTPFVWGVASLATRRGSGFATWGAVLAGSGLGGAAVANGFWFTNVRATDPALAGSREVMVQFLGLGAWPLAVLGLLEIVCLPLGIALLAVGLGRSKAVSWLLPGLLMLGFALFLALPDHFGAIGAGLLFVVTVLLFAPVAGRGPWAQSSAPS